MATAYVTLLFRESEERPFLSDLSNLMYDFELAHDLSVLVADPEYKAFRFSRFFYYRKGRPLKPEDRVRAARIRQASPLLLDLVIPCLGGLWILLQIIEKVQTWELSREKLRLELRRLQWEEEQRRADVLQIYQQQIDELLAERDAQDIADRVIQRLNENPNRLVDLDIDVVEEDDD